MGIYLPKIFIFERILKFFSKKFGSLKNIRTFAIPNGKNAEIAQLVEHNLAKVGVASSSLVFRSKTGHLRMTFVMRNNQTWYNYMQVVLYTGRLFSLYADLSFLFHELLDLLRDVGVLHDACKGFRTFSVRKYRHHNAGMASCAV